MMRWMARTTHRPNRARHATEAPLRLGINRQRTKGVQLPAAPLSYVVGYLPTQRALQYERMDRAQHVYTACTFRWIGSK